MPLYLLLSTAHHHYANNLRGLASATRRILQDLGLSRNPEIKHASKWGNSRLQGVCFCWTTPFLYEQKKQSRSWDPKNRLKCTIQEGAVCFTSYRFCTSQSNNCKYQCGNGQIDP
jgi:hypothetical protein